MKAIVAGTPSQADYSAQIIVDHDVHGMDDFAWVETSELEDMTYDARIVLPDTYEIVYRCTGEREEPDCIEVPVYEPEADRPYYTVSDGNTIVHSRGFSGAGGSNEDRSKVVDGLEFETVIETWGTDAIQFRTSYMELELAAEQVFVPDALNDFVTDFTYTLVEWNDGDDAIVSYNLQYEQIWEADYPTEDLRALLGNDGTANSSYPANYHQMDDTVAATTNDADHRIFDITLVDEEDAFNVSWKIYVTSHYEHLIITYDLYFQNDTHRDLVHSWEDVYRGGEPDLIPIHSTFLGKTGFNEPYYNRIGITPDNRYRSDRNVTIIFAFENERELVDTQFPNIATEVDAKKWYEEYKERAAQTGVNGSLVAEEDAFAFVAFNTTIDADSLQQLSILTTTEIDSTDRAYAFILGSHGGFTDEGDSHIYTFNGPSEGDSKYTEELVPGTYNITVHGADGGDSADFDGGVGGFIQGVFEADDGDQLEIWAGEKPDGLLGGWGRNTGGDGGEGRNIEDSGLGGGGSTEVLLNSDILAVADAGGGSTLDTTHSGGGGGGARGGTGGSGHAQGADGMDADGAGEGGDGGDARSDNAGDGGQEAGIALTVETQQTGGAEVDPGGNGHGWVEITLIDKFEEPPSVETLNAEDVNVSGATLHGNLTNLGTADAANVSFRYRKTGGAWTHTENVTMVETGVFTETITGLESNTEHEFQALAHAVDGTDQGDSELFTTYPLPAPMLTVHHPENTTLTTEEPWLNVTADMEVDTWKYDLNGAGNESFTPNITLGPLEDGEYKIEVWANNTDNVWNSSSRWFTIDAKGPLWRNQMQNASLIAVGEPVELAAEGIASQNLSHAILATNETGEFQNKSVYGSPMQLYTGGAWTWSNFTWQNTSITDVTVAWRIWYNDTKDRYNVTDVATFQVEPPVPGTITVDTQPLDTEAGQTIQGPPTALVEDGFGNPVEGVDVEVSVNDSSFAGGTMTVETDGNGEAVFNDLAIEDAGVYELTFTEQDQDNSASSEPFNIEASNPDNVSVVTQPQATEAGQEIGGPPTANVADEFGNPLKGVDVTVTVNDSVFASGTTVVETDEDGLAVFNNLVMEAAGVYELAFDAENVGVDATSDSFVIEPSDADDIGMVTQPQDTTAGEVIQGPPTVNVTDVFGNPIENEDVVVSRGDGEPFDGGTTTVATDGSGEAVFTDLVIEDADVYTLVFELADDDTVTASSDTFAIEPSDPDHMVIAVQPQGTPVNESIGGPPTVEIRDEFENVVADENIDVTATLNESDFNTGTTMVNTDGDGTAVFDNLEISEEGTYEIIFNADHPGVEDVTSDPFKILKITLDVQVQPSDTAAGDVIEPTIEVYAEDGEGDPMAGESINVTLNASTFSAGATTVTTNGSGVASFNDLIIEDAGTYYMTFILVEDGVSTSSDPFTISSADQDHVAVDTQPLETEAGKTIQGPPTALVEDPYGNPVEGVEVDVSVNDSTFTSGTTTIETGADGLAIFDDLVMDNAGVYELEFDADDVTVNATTDPFTIEASEPDTVLIDTQPQDTDAGETIQGPPTVLVEDEFGNPVPDIYIDVSVNASGFANGATTVSTEGDGLAVFNDLVIEDTGVYELTFTEQDQDNSASSEPFKIEPADPENVDIVVQPGDTKHGDPITGPPTVNVTDAFGNAFPGKDISVELNASSFSSGTTTVETDGEGEAVFDDLVVEDEGSYELTFEVVEDPSVSTTSDPFMTDGTPPQIIIHHPVNATLDMEEPWLNVSTDKETGTWKYNLDGAGNTTFQPNITFGALEDGSHTVVVWVNDTVDNWGQKERTFTIDTTPPLWRNQQQNTSLIDPREPIELVAEGFDATNLSYATLATNETGEFENKTVYGSPQFLGTSETWTWSNFTWWNNSVVNETVGWRIWYNDSGGNYNVTDTGTFVVTEGRMPDITVHHPENATLTTDEPWLNVTADTEIDTWQYNLNEAGNESFTPNLTLVTLEDGQHSITVWANSTDGLWNKSVRFFTTDVSPPLWRNQVFSPEDPVAGTGVELAAQGFDTVDLSHAILATNETGEWENKTTYGSPQTLGTSETWTWSNFTWNNNSLGESDTVAWRVWYNDSVGQYNVTDVEVFSLRVVPVLDVELHDPLTPFSLAQNYSFLLNATATCVNGPCGAVTGVARYNASSSVPDTWIASEESVIRKPTDFIDHADETVNPENAFAYPKVYNENLSAETTAANEDPSITWNTWDDVGYAFEELSITVTASKPGDNRDLWGFFFVNESGETCDSSAREIRPLTDGAVAEPTNFTASLPPDQDLSLLEVCLVTDRAGPWDDVLTFDVRINGTVQQGPFQILEGSNQLICDTALSDGETCSVSWEVNATGPIDSVHLIDVNFTSDDEGVVSSSSAAAEIEILEVFIDFVIGWDAITFGSLAPGSTGNPAVNNSDLLYNITITEWTSERVDLWLRGTDLEHDEGAVIDVSRISWNASVDDAEFGLPLSSVFQLAKRNVASESNVTTFYWVDIPKGKPAGEYEGLLEVKVNETS